MIQLGTLEEIEIAPAMIEAGSDAMCAAYGGLSLNPDPSCVAERVFRAMLAASPVLPTDREHRPRG